MNSRSRRQGKMTLFSLLRSALFYSNWLANPCPCHYNNRIEELSEIYSKHGDYNCENKLLSIFSMLCVVNSLSFHLKDDAWRWWWCWMQNDECDFEFPCRVVLNILSPGRNIIECFVSRCFHECFCMFSCCYREADHNEMRHQKRRCDNAK